MQKDDKRPIGVFDSGLGGLTVLKELIKLLPNEDFIYLGDTARVPYGTRSSETIKRFSDEDVKFLLSKNVKAVVIACNTSSAVAYTYIKNKYKSTPIFEVIKPASMEAVRNGNKIGVIGTNATVKSQAYTRIINNQSMKVKVTEIACPLLVPFIEEGEVDGIALKTIVRKYISNFGAKINVLIMGCTHYPIIENIIKMEVGRNVSLINPGICVSKEVFKFLKQNKIMNGQKVKGKVTFFVTDVAEKFAKVAEMFLGEKNKGKIIKINLVS